VAPAAVAVAAAVAAAVAGSYEAKAMTNQQWRRRSQDIL
jgi:hypothetical protein